MIKSTVASLGSELIAEDGQSARWELIDRVVECNQRADDELEVGASGDVVATSSPPWLR